MKKLSYLFLICLFINTAAFAKTTKLDNIVKQILKEERNYKKIIKSLKDTQKQLAKNKQLLIKLDDRLVELESKSKDLNAKKEKIQSEVVDFVSKKYALTVALNQESKVTEKTAVNKEVYKVLLLNAKNHLNDLDNLTKKLLQDISRNQDKIDSMSASIQKAQDDKKNLEAKKQSQKSLLKKLRIQKVRVAKELEEKKNKNKEKTVKSVFKNAPLSSYVIVRNFGPYFDSEKNIELFSEGILLKTKFKNADVFNIKAGKVVYVKKNSNILGNVVIVKHKNDLYTIYSYLAKISKKVKSGKSVKKGFVLGKVNNTLQFRITKNTKYINPLPYIK